MHQSPNSNCDSCCFHSDEKVPLIKHLFEAHCLQEDFRFECEFPLCNHYFTTGATYASFLTHCNRKHSNWRSALSAGTCAGSMHDDHSDHLMLSHHSGSLVTEHSIAPQSCAEIEGNCNSLDDIARHENDTCDTAEEEAALFLLTLKEKFKLSQASLNFAVEHLNNIVNQKKH